MTEDWDDVFDLMTMAELQASHPSRNRFVRIHHLEAAFTRIRFYASVHPEGREYATGAIDRLVKAAKNNDISVEQLTAAYDMRIKIMEAAPMN